MTPSENPKRFYKSVATTGDEPFQIQLDGRPLKTPAKAELSLPTITLAQAIAEEWDRQNERLDIARMHITRLANVAIDRTPETRAAMAQEIANYVGTDLLCHLANGPGELVERQARIWGPIRDWAGQSLNVVTVPVEGIMAARQPPASLEAAAEYALSLDDFRLTGLAYACGLFGSALLAMAASEAYVTAEEAFAISRLDEDYQIERWGEDDEARIAKEAREVEAKAVGVWFEALS
ncbi:MAG: ATP12 family protein [Pseudomonadota bacterium]